MSSRTHYRDAKCLNNLGLYVSRDNSKNCFLQLSSSHNDADHRGQPNMSPPVYPPTKTLPSRRPHSVRFPIKSKQAWTTTGGSIASAPNTSPNDSRETFSSGAESTKSGPKSTLIDGSHLSQRRDSVGSTKSSQSDDSCVLCQSGKLVQKGCNPAWSLPKRNSHNPARVWSGKKSNREPRQSFPKDVASNKTSKSLDITSKNREVRKPLHSWQKTYDHMLVQQYHLRILGTRAGVHDGVASAPRSNFIYQNARTKPKTEETKNDENKNNDHKNATGDLNAKLKDQPGTDAENQSRLSSRISVRISSSNQQGDDKVVHDVDKSPRSEDVNLGSTQMSDANDEVTTREDLTKLVEEIEISGKEDGKGVGGEGVGGEGVDGEGVVAEGVDGKGVDGEGVDREGVVAEGVGGEGVDGEGVNGEGVDRESVDGEGVVAEGVDGEGVVGEGVVAEGVDGEGVDGEGLDREGVVVEGVVAEGVDGDGDEEVGDGDVGGTVPSEAVIDQKDLS